MIIKKDEYQNMVDEIKPKNTVFKNTVRAFIVGGFICVLAETVKTFLLNKGLVEEDAGAIVTLLFIFLGVFLTGIGVYEKIGKYAGAGSIVPISGFANSVASPAIEHKKEGYISGVGTKIFTVSGPVILYGTFTSIIVGLLHYLLIKL